MNLEKKTFNSFMKNARFLTKKNNLSVLNHIAVSVDEDFMHLKCTDIQTWLFADIPFNKNEFPVGESFKDYTLYSVDTLATASKVNKGKLLSVSIIDNDIYFGEIRLIPSSLEYAQFPDFEFPIEAIKGQGIFGTIDTLKRAHEFISSDETRYYMNGVYFEAKNNKLLVVATDGRILYKSGKTGNTFNGPETSFILRDFHKFLNLNLTSFRVNEKGVLFNDDIFQLYVRKIEGLFPNYQRVFPEFGNTREWKLKLSDLKLHVDKITTLCEMKSLKKKDYNTIKVLFLPGWIEIRSEEYPYREKFENDLKRYHDNNGYDEKICFNLHNLKKLINDENEKSLWVFKGNIENKVMLVRYKESGAEELYMPMTIE